MTVIFLSFTITIVAILTAMPQTTAAFSTMNVPNHISPEEAEHGKEPNFHKILERVGKTCLRPGGTVATVKLMDWSSNDLGSHSKVLELSAGLGRTGLLFAERFECDVWITDIDENRLKKAQELASQKSLDSLVHTKTVDMFDIDSGLGKDSYFDCAITEASLTHFSLDKKRDFFTNLAPHTDQYLLHEICFKTDDPNIQKQVRREMQQVLKISFFPETESTWHQLLKGAGFTNVNIDKERQVGDISIVNPSTLLQDEGPWGLANIIKNIATQPYTRSRVLATRAALMRNRKYLGYIIIRATKPKTK